jgi:hypothetical protein
VRFAPRLRLISSHKVEEATLHELAQFNRQPLLTAPHLHEVAVRCIDNVEGIVIQAKLVEPSNHIIH